MTERSVPRIWRGKRALSDEYVAVDDGGDCLRRYVCFSTRLAGWNLEVIDNIIRKPWSPKGAGQADRGGVDVEVILALRPLDPWHTEQPRPKRLEGVPSSRRSAQPSAGSLRGALHIDLLELLGEE